MKKLWLAFVMLSLFSMLGTAYAASGGTDRPWHLTGSGTTTVTPAFSSGTFRATHTGAGTFVGTFVVAGFPPPCSVGSVPVTGTNTLTAANGDKINQTTSGTVCQSGPTPTFHTTGTYTNNGGTGRFTTATGTGSQISDVSFPNGLGQPGTFAFTQDGTISY